MDNGNISNHEKMEASSPCQTTNEEYIVVSIPSITDDIGFIEKNILWIIIMNIPRYHNLKGNR